MKIFFSIIVTILFPLQLFAADDATRVYLRLQPLDAWGAMARAALDDRVSAEELRALPRTNTMDLAKFILALAAQGTNPKDFFGHDYVADLLAMVVDQQIGHPSLLNDDAWGLLALRAGGVASAHPAIIGVMRTLITAQNADGGWGYAQGGVSDTNDTAAVVMALLEAGSELSNSAIQHALVYFAHQQNDDGGYSFNRDQFPFSDGASDAWVLSALAKTRDALRDRRQNGMTVADHLRSLQHADGSYAWQRGATHGSLGVTTSAAIALAGKWFPVERIIINKSDSAAPPSADTLRCRGRSPCSAWGPLRWPIGASDTPSPPRSAVPSTRPLSSAEGSAAESVSRIVSFPAFFPSLVATSVFSRPEKVTVVAVSPRDLTPTLSYKERGRDSDGDGYPDDVEIANGYDPHDARPVKITKSKKQKIKKAPRTILRQAQEVRGKQKKK